MALVSIDTQLFLLTGGLALGMTIVAWQAFRLREIYRSRSALVGAVTFLLLGSRQVYNLFRLRSNIADARTRGIMIDHLSLEQWLVGVVWGYAIVIGFLIWMHWQHRDLKRLGL